jgi:hypothetical protein
MYAIASVTFICFKCGRVSSALAEVSSSLVVVGVAVTGTGDKLTAGVPFVDVMGLEYFGTI